MVAGRADIARGFLGSRGISNDSVGHWGERRATSSHVWPSLLPSYDVGSCAAARRLGLSSCDVRRLRDAISPGARDFLIGGLVSGCNRPWDRFYSRRKERASVMGLETKTLAPGFPVNRMK